jgi:hypothetical protein
MRTACSVCKRQREPMSGILLSVGLGTCGRLASSFLFQPIEVGAQFIDAGSEGGEGGEVLALLADEVVEGFDVVIVDVLQIADEVVEDFEIVAQIVGDEGGVVNGLGTCGFDFFVRTAQHVVNFMVDEGNDFGIGHGSPVSSRWDRLTKFVWFVKDDLRSD